MIAVFCHDTSITPKKRECVEGEKEKEKQQKTRNDVRFNYMHILLVYYVTLNRQKNL